MRRIIYIHERDDWPQFTWDDSQLTTSLAAIRHGQGKLLGRMESFGFDIRQQANLQTLTQEIVKSSEIEGELLDSDQVRSSIARQLGMNIAGLVPSDRHTDGVVEMMMDATQHFEKRLTKKRLLGWHASLFPTGYSGMYKITVGDWRTIEGGPMQVVSGAMGKEKVHYEAPTAEGLEKEMTSFLDWFNKMDPLDPVIKAAIAHLWFVTIHPFDDGNGRIARAIGELQLSRADETAQRFYSMSAQIRKERNAYYDVLEQTQKGTMDITKWLQWFLSCLERAFQAADETLTSVLNRSKFWNKFASIPLNARQQHMVQLLLTDFAGKLNTSKWAKINKTSTDTALRDIQDLVLKGMLKQEESGGRSTSYQLILE